MGHESRPIADDVFCAFFGKPLRRLFVDLNPLRRTCMSRTRIALVGGLAAALLVVSAGSAMAAPPSSDTQNQTVQLTLDTPLVDFGNVDPLTQYAAGGGNATVKANAGWTLSMTAPANFTETGGGLNTIPIGRLSLKPGAGAYTAVASGANAVSSGARTTNAGTATALAYHLDLQFGDNPNTAGDQYQAVLVYTATTP